MEAKSMELRINELIGEYLGIHQDEIKPESSFIDDFGCDSLDTIELVMAIEEEFGLEIPDSELEGIKTVQDAINYVASHRTK